MNDPRFIPSTGPFWYAAKGAWVSAARRGHRYLDFRSGVMTASMGHAPWRVAMAAMVPMLRGQAQAWYSPNAVRDRALEELEGIAPDGFDEVAFVVTGSEAVEVACRAALSMANTDVVAHWTGNYHGNTTWILDNLNGKRGVHFDLAAGRYPPGVGVMAISPYLGPVCKWMTPARAKSFQRWVDGEGIILVDDELQAGFGRCGAWWGVERYGGVVKPHIIAAGKAATGLLPLSLVMFRRDVSPRVMAGDYISTHAGNPACLAALVANIRWMRKVDVPRKALAIGSEIKLWAEGLVNRGLAAGFDGAGAAWSVHAPWAFEAQQVAYRNGVLTFDLGPAVKSIKIAPPLNIDREDMKWGLKTIAKALEIVAPKEMR
ncbi:MAG: aminotransferase class III-fold pyridoxal phosphate-dependent enzyme [Gallionellaceae bacterium]|nr:aminotransferase class III-fold pyridoxal phosphate-dependent enzyme [Gallionellaceae bacterium]